MAANSDGGSTTIVTCEGNLSDPEFPQQLENILNKLETILGDQLKVRKLEPWNSVRVTLSVPREAALRLRQLASDGSQQLRALGILSVQVEGDQVISLRLASTSSSEPQEIVLETISQDDNRSNPQTSTSNAEVPVPDSSFKEKVQFRSPNVVCPPDSTVPKVPLGNTPVTHPTNLNKTFSGPFPFTSMNQAITSRGENPPPATYNAPPPPYPGKTNQQPVTLSSPLLVNLLQNEGGASTSTPKPAPEICTNTTTPNNAVAVAKFNQGFLQQQKPMLVKKIIQGRPPILGQNSTVTHLPQGVVRTATQHPIQQVPQPVKAPPPPTPHLLLQNKTLPMDSVFENRVVEPPMPSNNAKPVSVPYRPNTTVYNTWDSTTIPPLQDLTPSLTELKPDDLDSILPTLELENSPLEIPEEFVQKETTSQVNFLINPLTGELEPQSSSESEPEEIRDVFTGLPSPAAMTDDDTNSTIRPDTTDQSDSETRSSHSDSGKHFRLKTAKSRDKGRDSPSLKGGDKLKPTEKIKLRLKLEKSEPINQAYKVDVSFINTQQNLTVGNNKKLPMQAAGGISSTSNVSEELRVPPLHISLRGRNHAVINNKKKIKLEKSRKLLEHRNKKAVGEPDLEPSTVDALNNRLQSTEMTSTNHSLNKINVDMKKLKKAKLQDYREQLDAELKRHNLDLYNLHFKEKHKERRGSDSELVKSKTNFDASISESSEKKRRLSQTEDANFELQPIVLGSTNTGTVPNHKIRKEKVKLKETFKSKDLLRPSKKIDLTTKQVSLPTGDVDMEAKIKQRLLEEMPVSSNFPSNSTNDEEFCKIHNEHNSGVEDLIETLSDVTTVKDKPPEPDKCNTPDGKSDISDKQTSRSPNSGAQGEDSGIESMDALSEKSPNQASQSPHTDVSDLKSKTQGADLLDIEAQLAKMEGFNGGEDLNENHHNAPENLEKCCELKSVLHEKPVEEIVETTKAEPVVKHESDIGVQEDLDPLPLRINPPLYTYSNPEKGRGSESPTLSDSDSNPCSTKKSLLEQLLIEIPENPAPSSPSPATRSLRTRASSKLNSPELNSPVPASKQVRLHVTKRKRHESEGSNNSIEDLRSKKAKKMPSMSENNTAEQTKGAVKKKVSDESSDSDEPLIEIAGKVRKSNQLAPGRTKLKATAAAGTVNNLAVKTATTNNVNTRRSVRAIPALNTRSKGDKSNPENDILRRKTRSAVSEGEGRRKRDVK